MTWERWALVTLAAGIVGFAWGWAMSGAVWRLTRRRAQRNDAVRSDGNPIAPHKIDDSLEGQRPEHAATAVQPAPPGPPDGDRA